MALLPTGPALAHVDVQPRLVEHGIATELRIELPRLRAGAPPIRLEVAGHGVTALSTERDGVVRGETRWNVRLRVDAQPGVVPVTLRAVYADGRSVEVGETLTVVPAGQEPGFAWPLAIGAVLLAASLAVAALVVARRRA